MAFPKTEQAAVGVAPITETVLQRWGSWLLLLLVLLGYANSFPGTFVQDDLTIVVDNPLLNSLDFAKIFSSDYWGYGFSSGLYRPFTILSLYINRLLLGENVWGYHLVNVFFHAGVVQLLWALLRRWGFPVAAAFLAAVLFADHPIHTEVVDVVVGRSELLVALLLLGALFAATRQGLTSAVAVVGLFAAALLAKEHAVTFLALLPIIDIFRNKNLRILRQRWPLYASLLLVTACWLAWRAVGIVHFYPRDADFNALNGLPLTTRIPSALMLQLLYLCKLFWPHHLQINYQGSDFSAFIVSLQSLPGLLEMVGVFGLGIALVAGWRRFSPLALCATLYLVSFAVTGNLLLVTGVTFAERLVYFPSVWFCAGMGWLVAWLAARVNHAHWVWALALVGMLLLGGRLWIRNVAFNDSVRLWQIDVVYDPTNIYSRLGLAEAYARDNRHQQAERIYQEMFDLPGGQDPITLTSWAKFLMRHNRLAEALAPLRQAAKLRMDKQQHAGGELWLLASLCLDLERDEEALYWLDRRREQYGRPANDWAIRAQALERLGRLQEAAAAYSQVSTWPQGSSGPLRYARVLFQLGQEEQSLGFLLPAVSRLEGIDLAEAYNLIGVIQARRGQKGAAAAAFSQALSIDPENSHYLGNLQRVTKGMPGSKDQLHPPRHMDE